MSAVPDCHGQPLYQGSRVRAWHDGTEYTATVSAVSGVRQPGDECQLEEGCQGHRHLALTRESDGALMQSTSDAVTVIE